MYRSAKFTKVFYNFDRLNDRFIIVAKRAQRGQNPRPYRTYWGKSPLRSAWSTLPLLKIKPSFTRKNNKDMHKLGFKLWSLQVNNFQEVFFVQHFIK